MSSTIKGYMLTW